MSDLESMITGVKAAMEPSASSATTVDAIDALRALAERAYETGDAEAYAVYQRLLFELHYGPPSQDHWRAQYLASTVYDLEDRRLAVAVPNDGFDEPLLGSEELRALIWGPAG